MGLYLTDIVVSAAAYLLSFMAASHAYYALSGSILLFAALALYVLNVIREHSLCDPPAVFTLSWTGGAGISAFKLSALQSDWCLLTWAVIFLTYAFFIAGYAIFLKAPGKSGASDTCIRECVDEDIMDSHDVVISRSALLAAVNIVTLLSLLSFAAEAYILGYIPLFTSDTPHAYSYFHVSGMHYFTVSCVLAMPLAVLYRSLYPASYRMPAVAKADLAACSLVSIVLPVMMVSRYEVIFSIGLSVMVLLSSGRHLLPAAVSIRHVLCLFFLAAAFLVIYVFITYERAHSAEYLGSIYEMKSADMPIFIAQPYIYIANNYDNLNCLIEGLGNHSYGLRMLYPFFALTGLKFRYADLLSFPLFITKEELTTLTLVYDAYYDFGVPGVILLSLVLGMMVSWLRVHISSPGAECPMLRFFYAQILFYLALSFFTTWFSNPTTWFYFAATCAIALFIRVSSEFLRLCSRNKANVSCR